VTKKVASSEGLKAGSRENATLAARLLLLLSRKPGDEEYETGTPRPNLQGALNLLFAVFPDFGGRIFGRSILDFGCGLGYQAVALVKAGAKHVVGLETNPKTLNKARELAASAGVPAGIEFTDCLEPRFQSAFDVVISQNSFEHFRYPSKTLEDMKWALKDDGCIFVTFAPPWFAPYGSHMHFFTKVPWVNILFSEETVMAVRSHFRSDGASRYEEVESGLNKMSLAKFERIVRASSMTLLYRRYESVKGLDFLGTIPLIRELFVNRVSCILQKTP